MKRLRGFGLRIASSIPVRGAIPDAWEGMPDIVIERGNVPAWDAVIVDDPYRVGSAALFDFTMAGVARFTAIDRQRLIVDAAPDADPAVVEDMLIATALPALLWARGGVVLHAAAAVFPGAAAALAIAGDSGMGKSTWLARAVASGAQIVADDSLLLTIDGDHVIGAGLSGGFFRCDDHGGGTRTFIDVPLPRQSAPVPIGAIMVLYASLAASDRLEAASAVAALLRHRHRPRIARLLGLDATAFATIATIARTVPLIQISRETIR